MFEPDLSIICDKSKLDDAGCKGSPELYSEEERVKVSIFDDLIIDLNMVF